VESLSQAALERCEKEGFEFYQTIWNVAAKVDSVNAVSWLRKKQIPFDTEKFLKMAWKNKSHQVLRWACDFVQDSTTMQPAQEDGSGNRSS